jgi:hypothetical protein
LFTVRLNRIVIPTVSRVLGQDSRPMNNAEYLNHVVGIPDHINDSVRMMKYFPDVVMLVFRHLSTYARMLRHTLDPFYDGFHCSVSIKVNRSKIFFIKLSCGGY